MTRTISETLHIQQILQSISPDLATLLDNVHQFPFSWRKALLKHSRIQRSSTVNTHVSAIYETIPQYEFQTPSGVHVTRDWLRNIADELLDSSPVCASIISMFVRCEAYNSKLETPGEVAEETRDKELQAALQEDREGVLQYAFLFKPAKELNNLLQTIYDADVAVDYVDPQDLIANRRLYQLWSSGLERYKERLQSQRYVIVPSYNKRKNVSYSTQDNTTKPFRIISFSNRIQFIVLLMT